jgi:hypothetical protein
MALAASAVALANQDDSTRSRDVVDAQISPDGSSVLFARSGAIWRIPFSGGDTQRVTAGESATGRPRWSPDGREIAFLRIESPSAPPRIFVMTADAQAERAITPPSIPVVAFEWSPSGRRIAFVSGGSDSALWVMDANGNGLRRLGSGMTAAFAWAPDDRAIARVVGASLSGLLPAEVIAVDGNVPPRPLAREVHRRISWSRDGTIALIGRDPDRLLLAGGPGFAIREVLVPAVSALADVVSLGDGHLSLTFMSNQGSWIERLTIATGERITVMPPGIARNVLTPSWSLDGTRYVIAAKEEAQIAEVYAGTVPLPESGRPDFVGARPPPVRRITSFESN